MSRPRLACCALALALVASVGQAQEAKSCEPQDLSALRSWSGVWMAEGTETDINGRELPGAPPPVLGMKLIGLTAPWNDEGWKRFESGLGPPDGTTSQSGWGFPMMMSAPSPFTIVVGRDQTVMIGEYRDIRYVFTDGRGHLPGDDAWPTIWGDSVGCWEGDTLTIETVNVQYSPDYNMVAPTLSANARFVERLRLTAPDRLESEITITDPETLDRPWQVHMVYLRHPVIDRLVHEGDTLANNRLVLEDGEVTIAPPRQAPTPRTPREAAKLGEAELDRVTGVYTLDGTPFEMVIERRGERMFNRTEPIFPIDLPIHPADPLNYFSRLHQGTLRFVTDEQGRVTGFTGTSPEGDPISGTRKPD